MAEISNIIIEEISNMLFNEQGDEIDMGAGFGDRPSGLGARNKNDAFANAAAAQKERGATTQRAAQIAKQLGYTGKNFGFQNGMLIVDGTGHRLPPAAQQYINRGGQMPQLRQAKPTAQAQPAQAQPAQAQPAQAQPADPVAAKRQEILVKLEGYQQKIRQGNKQDPLRVYHWKILSQALKLANTAGPELINQGIAALWKVAEKKVPQQQPQQQPWQQRRPPQRRPQGGAQQQNSRKVRGGDSLWKIARESGVTVQQLQKANNMGQSNLIKPGQVLKIPAAARQQPAAGKSRGGQTNPQQTKALTGQLQSALASGDRKQIRQFAQRLLAQY